MPELPEVAALTTFLGGHLRGAVVTKIQIVSFAVLKTADPPFSGAGGPDRHRRAPVGKFVSLDADGLFLSSTWPGPAGSATPNPRDAQLKMGKGQSRRGWRSPATAGPARHGPDRGRHEEEPGGLCGPGSARRSRHRRAGPGSVQSRFGLDAFAGILGSSSQQIKGLLRSQGVIAGIGNAYSDEILHAARISPFAIAKSLDPEASASLRRHPQRSGRGRDGGRGQAAHELKDAKRSPCGSMAGPASRARSAGTRSGKCPSPTPPCSTVPRARPRARSWPTAGPPGS